MYSHNYKGLKYKDSLIRFIKDYRLKYWLYGRNKKYKTKHGDYIKVKDLSIVHIRNIVNKCGHTTTRSVYPFVFYRYLKECYDERKI